MLLPRRTSRHGAHGYYLYDYSVSLLVRWRKRLGVSYRGHKDTCSWPESLWVSLIPGESGRGAMETGNIPTAGLSPAPGHLLLHFQNSKTLKVTCIHLPGFGTSYPLYFKHLILTFFAIVILMISLSQNLLFCSFQCTEM